MNKEIAKRLALAILAIILTVAATPIAVALWQKFWSITT